MSSPTQIRLAREALEKTRQDMLDEGFHFPNEWLANIDWAIVVLGGKTLDDSNDDEPAPAAEGAS